MVLGCGAIGGTVAAGLARDGHDVLVSDADPAVVSAVNSDGLRICGPVEEFTAYPRAVGPDALPVVLDHPVLLAVKAHQAAAAAGVLAGCAAMASLSCCRTACPGRPPLLSARTGRSGRW